MLKPLRTKCVACKEIIVLNDTFLEVFANATFQKEVFYHCGKKQTCSKRLPEEHGKEDE